MKFKDENFFKMVRGFLTVYLPRQKCFSPNTVKSYREAINLLLDFLNAEKGVPLTQVTFELLDHSVICEFLDWLQDTRKCSTSTRNQRLMALKSFVKYAGMEDPAQIAVQMELKKVPVKKAAGRIVDFLSENALKALFAQPDPANIRGIRNRFFMILMYDTAARCQEMLDLRVGDIRPHAQNSVAYLTGKGSKMRTVPLMEKTVGHCHNYLGIFHPPETRRNDDYLFYTVIHGEKHQMSADNVACFMKKYGEAAKSACPDIPRRVHPHQIRHSRAIHLYRAGMPLPLVADFLGHVGMNTVQVYAYADTEMKRLAMQKATTNVDIGLGEEPFWKDDADIVRKLYGLI